MTAPDWSDLCIALSVTILAAAAVIALLMAGRRIRRRHAAERAAAAQAIFSAERELWLNCLTDREMTAALAVRLGFTPDFLGAVQLKAENAVRILLLLRHHDAIYQQHLQGQLAPDAWDALLREMRSLFRDPRSQRVFDRSRGLLSSRFVQFAVQELLPGP